MLGNSWAAPPQKGSAQRHRSRSQFLIRLSRGIAQWFARFGSWLSLRPHCETYSSGSSGAREHVQVLCPTTPFKRRLRLIPAFATASPTEVKRPRPSVQTLTIKDSLQPGPALAHATCRKDARRLCVTQGHSFGGVH